MGSIPTPGTRSARLTFVASFYITGGRPIRGQVTVAGSKNAVLPLLAAALLAPGQTRLTNVPEIADVQVQVELLRDLGATVAGERRLTIISPRVLNHKLAPGLVSRLRASLLLLGPLLARSGRATLTHPGGDVIGKRPLTTHLKLLTDLGYAVRSSDTTYTIVKKYQPRSRIYLREQSVTATELALMLAPLEKRPIRLIGLALEPHVTTLGQYLINKGAEITGLGGPEALIRPSTYRRTTKGYRLAPDPIEVATFAVLFLASRGQGTVEGVNPHELDALFATLEEMGARLTVRGRNLSLKPSALKATPIQVRPYPGLATDMGPALAVLATQAHGPTLVHDWMFERRFGYIDALISMGANITLCDPHRFIITGPTSLHARHLLTPDIRAGMALLTAAAIAHGTSRIDNIEQIERGYERVVPRLKALGVSIRRSTEDDPT